MTCTLSQPKPSSRWLKGRKRAITRTLHDVAIPPLSLTHGASVAVSLSLCVLSVWFECVRQGRALHPRQRLAMAHSDALSLLSPLLSSPQSPSVSLSLSVYPSLCVWCVRAASVWLAGVCPAPPCHHNRAPSYPSSASQLSRESQLQLSPALRHYLVSFNELRRLSVLCLRATRQDSAPQSFLPGG